ncbi:uncharacterized protein SCHCODRAFT_02678701 [Schizophyllum commune H4-8]|uniref:Uncharacterized protein n=1 Tax=Schizophyllum commune (strain H4-8 / FGSC 9210) TaxID=578458 RepID=D8Q6B2_SCHCM|nr:uncharacterized protein SCHCODRAFT_02678701 [Schizophyllum commune H4-8]KAI5891023.1 hypothetical protein SCHCODRAFT_02678701 [Schizophyllum commune H4-8]
MVLEWTSSRFGHTFYTKDGESFECPWGFCFPPINMPAHITIDDLVRAEPLPPRELPWSYEADKHLFSEPVCPAPPSERSVSPTPSEVEVVQTVLPHEPPSPPRSPPPLDCVSSPCSNFDYPVADRYGAATFVPQREILPDPKPLVLSTAIVKIMAEVTKDIGLRHRAIPMVENATGKCYGDVQAFNIPEVVANYLEERAHRLKELVDGFKDPEGRKRAYESAIERWQEAAAAAEKSREAAGKATGKAPKKGRASSKASAKAGSKRNRSEEDEEASDRPAKRARGGRGSDMSERIEQARNDPTVKSYGAHHIICAGCDEEIAAEGRRDLYLCSLRNKHKLEKCAGLARWATQPPSQEDMKAWQAARNKCAEISQVYLLAKDRRIHKCQCRRLGAGLEEDRLLRYEANKQRVADGNAARAAQA